MNDLCQSETISTIDVSAFDAKNLNLVTGAAQSYTLSSTTNNGLTCPVTYQFSTAVTGPKPSLITLSGKIITFASSNVLSDAGQYSFAVQAQISTQTTWSVATTVTFNYVNPCLTATMSASGPCPDEFSVGVGATLASSPFALFQDSVTAFKNNGTFICAQTVSFQVASAPSATANSTMYQKFTYAATSSTQTTGTWTITAAPTLLAEVGVYTLKVVACVTANPNSCFQCNVAVTVTNPCLTASVTPSVVQNIDCYVFDPPTSSTFPSFTYDAGGSSTICGSLTYQVELSLGSEDDKILAFTVDSTALTFSYDTNLMGQISTKTATLKGFLTLFTNQQATATFTVTVKHPCLKTTLSWIQSWTEMTYSVLQAAPANFQAAFNDAVDITQQKNVLELCGPIKYDSISDIPDGTVTKLSNSELTLDSNGLIQILTDNKLTVGKHSILVDVYLQNYPNIIKTQTLSLEIHPCQITEFTANSPESKIYTIGDPKLAWAVLAASLATQTPNCGYSQTVAIVPSSLPVFQTTISESSQLYELLETETSEKAFSGIYTIQFDVSLSGYPYSNVPVPQITVGQSLTLKDPCQTAALQPSSISDIELYVFDPLTQSISFPSFTYDVGGSSTFCGSIAYEVELVPGNAKNKLTEFTVDSTDQTFWYSSDLMSQVGTYTQTLKGYLSDYPSVSTIANFEVKVLNPCWVTTLQWMESWNEMTYYVSQATPAQYQAAFNDAVDINQEMLTLELCGGITYDSINDAPNGAVIALSPEELTLDQNGLISIHTSNYDTIGKHTISMIVHLQNFPNITLTQILSLQIQHCQVTEFTPNDSILLSYTRNEPRKTWDVTANSLVTQTPDCGYKTIKIDLNTTELPFLTLNSTETPFQLAIQTRDKIHQYFTVPFNISLIGYPYSPLLQTKGSLAVVILDPCYSTKISSEPAEVENFIAFAGYSQISSSIYKYTDSISLIQTVSSDYVDFCGEKYFLSKQTEQTQMF